jgi:hypothetical protein
MGLRRTHMNENRFEPVQCRMGGRGTVKVVWTLDTLRPSGSLIWKARSEPIFVAPPILAGRVAARDGV